MRSVFEILLIIIVSHTTLCSGTANNGQRNLNSVLEKFADLIPMNKITDIISKHLDSDPEVQDVANYLRSPEFRRFINVLENMAAFTDLAEYLKSEGVDVYQTLNIINVLFELPPVTERTMTHRSSRSVHGMLSEILLALPLDKILNLYLDVEVNEPSFQKFLLHLHSPTMRSIDDTLKKTPEYQELVRRLHRYGISLEAWKAYILYIMKNPTY